MRSPGDSGHVYKMGPAESHTTVNWAPAASSSRNNKLPGIAPEGERVCSLDSFLVLFPAPETQALKLP